MFRVRPIMKQGTPSILKETWLPFETIEAARAAVKTMYHDDRVARAFIVDEGVPPQFVEWVDR